mmetsp:Transcript_27332/g.35409  ORF Transcript_27332/g.35409 Transcript_27332/m.35409 type:complete len:205 (+) Transcript_27332:825-1439(+)
MKRNSNSTLESFIIYWLLTHFLVDFGLYCHVNAHIEEEMKSEEIRTDTVNVHAAGSCCLSSDAAFQTTGYQSKTGVVHFVSCYTKAIIARYHMTKKKNFTILNLVTQLSYHGTDFLYQDCIRKLLKAAEFEYTPECLKKGKARLKKQKQQKRRRQTTAFKENEKKKWVLRRMKHKKNRQGTSSGLYTSNGGVTTIVGAFLLLLP